MFLNKELTKSDLNLLLKNIIEKYNKAYSLNVLDNLKILGFRFATISGFSLSVEDFNFEKNNLLFDVFYKQKFLMNKKSNFWLQNKLENANIFAWNETNNKLKSQINFFFKNFNPFNNIFLMSDSGVRGSILQVSQMIGFRGLMSDPSGEAVKYTIKHSFKEGLNLLEFLIAAFGSRKGIVDTALGTAESGYLTRRLVEFAYNLLIRTSDCKTKSGFLLKNLKLYNNKILSFNLLTKRINQGKLSLQKKNNIYNDNFPIKYIPIRNVLTCKSNINSSICQFCFGLNLATQNLISLGTPVGIISAQSVSEPSTQMTMRTFHTGGIFGFSENTEKKYFIGFLKYLSDKCVFFNWSNDNKKEENTRRNSLIKRGTSLWVSKKKWLLEKEKSNFSSIINNFELTYSKNCILLKELRSFDCFNSQQYIKGYIIKADKKAFTIRKGNGQNIKKSLLFYIRLLK